MTQRESRRGDAMKRPTSMRVSATHVEAMRELIRGDYGSAAELVASITRTGAETRAMRIGTAVHSAAELAARRMHEALAPLDYSRRFVVDERYGDGMRVEVSGDDMLHLVPFDVADPAAALEVRAIVPVEANGGNVTVYVSCILDALIGNSVYDYKATLDNREHETPYDDSAQWRLYLLAAGAKQFEYRRAVWRQHVNSEVDGTGTLGSITEHVRLELDRVATYRFSAYHGMRDDVAEVVGWLVDFIHARPELWPYVATRGDEVSPF